MTGFGRRWRSSYRSDSGRRGRYHTQITPMVAPRLPLLAVLLPALGAGSLAVRAHATIPLPEARVIQLAEAGVSMDQAVKMVEQRFKARVVRAETQHEDGRTIYVLRLLNDSGHVWTVRVDAASGVIL